MDGEVGRVRTERIYTLPSGGRGGRGSRDRRFQVGERESQPQDAPEDAHQEHGSVGHPDDDEAGRNLDITG